MIVYKGQGRLLKKSSNRKSKAVPSRLDLAGDYMAFKRNISYATDLAANFGCHRFRIMPDIVSKLLLAAIWSCCAVAVRFESEQTPFCTGFNSKHAVLFLCHISTQQLLANSIEIFISHEKKMTQCSPNFTKHYTLLTLELNQYRKRCSMFSSSEPLAASSDCRRFGNTLC